MRFRDFAALARCDLWRYGKGASAKTFLRHLVLVPGFRFAFLLRLCAFLAMKPLPWKPCYWIARLLLRHYRVKYGISISHRTQIGPGLYIGHFGGIVVNDQAKIGKNCSISHGVTIGKANRGKRMGYPTIGDSVYLGPGAKVLGNIRIGNNVAIGANAVVTADVPDGKVAAGVPARVISDAGSVGYITYTDYE